MEKVAEQNVKAPLTNGNRPFIQPKLTVNKPNDVYEQEADAMADKVMRMRIVSNYQI